MPLVVGIGELLWDLLPDGRQMGGAPANFAFHARALGAASVIVSAVGDDRPGREILAESECVRKERKKYIQYPAHPEYVELFDLANDPDEKRNLAGDPGHVRVLAELRERCGRTIGRLLDDQTKFK